MFKNNNNKRGVVVTPAVNSKKKGKYREILSSQNTINHRNLYDLKKKKKHQNFHNKLTNNLASKSP